MRIDTSGVLLLDHQGDYSNVAWEVYRCCLLRTLLSYNGRPTDEGGATLRPDLASRMPEVSEAGLTWTFRLKHGIHYAPPLQDIEITAQDFVRALDREAGLVHRGFCPRYVENGAFPGYTGYGFYYSVLKGFDDFACGSARTISGLQTPDPYTLIVQLTQPAGDLGSRFAMPAVSPIPPNPSRLDERLGVADGHALEVVDGNGPDRGYLRFLVASGPYMFAGSGALDFSARPEEQVPVSGFIPSVLDPDTGDVIQRGSITLVRNRAWNPETDPLRAAQPDRIEITTGVPPMEAAAAVDAGTADLMLGDLPPRTLVERYQASGERDRVRTNPADSIFWIGFNLAQPPFDDIHVRRAVNRVIDKTAIVQQVERASDLYRSPETATVATHIAPDSEESALLLTYDPYPTPDHGGSVRLARQEMRKSRYDQNGDGRCDAAVCRHVFASGYVGDLPGSSRALIAEDLERLGIHVDPKWQRTGYAWYYYQPSRRVALAIGANWGPDYPDAFQFFVPLFKSEDLGPDSCCNSAMLGATPRQLKDWGYGVTDVPNVDQRVNQCVPTVGSERTRCWASLDRYLMEQVVPWVPLLSLQNVAVLSTRVAGFSWDQSTTQPALDRIALTPEAIA